MAIKNLAKSRYVMDHKLIEQIHPTHAAWLSYNDSMKKELEDSLATIEEQKKMIVKLNNQIVSLKDEIWELKKENLSKY